MIKIRIPILLKKSLILIQNAKMKFVMTVLLIIEYGTELEHVYRKYFTKKCRYILYKNLFGGGGGGGGGFSVYFDQLLLTEVWLF